MRRKAALQASKNASISSSPRGSVASSAARPETGSPEHDEMEAKREKLRQEQEQEDLKQQQELANAMGITLEEMQMIDAAAEADTEEAISEYMVKFKEIDTDGSGSLSPEELRQVLEEVGEDMTEDALEAIIQEADKDGDGEINYDEFVAMMRARKRTDMMAKSMTMVRMSNLNSGSSSSRLDASEGSSSSLTSSSSIIGKRGSFQMGRCHRFS